MTGILQGRAVGLWCGCSTVPSGQWFLVLWVTCPPVDAHGELSVLCWCLISPCCFLPQLLVSVCFFFFSFPPANYKGIEIEIIQCCFKIAKQKQFNGLCVQFAFFLVRDNGIGEEASCCQVLWQSAVWTYRNKFFHCSWSCSIVFRAFALCTQLFFSRFISFIVLTLSTSPRFLSSKSYYFHCVNFSDCKGSGLGFLNRVLTCLP